MVADHHFMVQCRRTRKPRTKTSDLREGTAWMENDELMMEIAGTGEMRKVRRQVLRFVLGRGPVGEIEHDASYQSDDQASGK
jgi:hypothetical protein